MKEKGIMRERTGISEQGEQTILIVMLHTGLRTMEVCDVTPGDIQIGKRSGQLTALDSKIHESCVARRIKRT